MRAPISRKPEFVHKSTVRVHPNWISSSKINLRLASDKLVVGLLLGDKASTRCICGELPAGATTTMETDVTAETPDMSMTAVHGTSTSKRLSSQNPSECAQVRGPKHLLTTDTELQDDPARGGRAGLPSPWRILVLDGRGQAVRSAMVMPKLHRVL